MVFFMLINVKMPTIVVNVTCISMINTSESLKAGNIAIFSVLVLRAVEISCSVELSMKKV